MALPCKKPWTNLKEWHFNGNKKKLNTCLLSTASSLPSSWARWRQLANAHQLLQVYRFSFCFRYPICSVFSSSLTEVMDHWLTAEDSASLFFLPMADVINGRSDAILLEMWWSGQSGQFSPAEDNRSYLKISNRLKTNKTLVLLQTCGRCDWKCCEWEIQMCLEADI